MRPDSGLRLAIFQADATPASLSLHLAQPRSTRTAPQNGPSLRIPKRWNPIGRILRRESCHIPVCSVRPSAYARERRFASSTQRLRLVMLLQLRANSSIFRDVRREELNGGVVKSKVELRLSKWDKNVRPHRKIFLSKYIDTLLSDIVYASPMISENSTSHAFTLLSDRRLLVGLQKNVQHCTENSHFCRHVRTCLRISASQSTRFLSVKYARYLPLYWDNCLIVYTGNTRFSF